CAQLGQVTYGRDAGQEEVGPSPGPDELRQATVAATDRARRDGECCAYRVAAAGQRIRVVVEAVERGAVEPGVLDEFELPGRVARGETYDRPGPPGRPVAGGPPQQPVPVGGVEGGGRLGAQRVAGVGPADVGADGAGEAARVVAVGEVVVVGQRRGIAVR